MPKQSTVRTQSDSAYQVPTSEMKTDFPLGKLPYEILYLIAKALKYKAIIAWNIAMQVMDSPIRGKLEAILKEFTKKDYPYFPRFIEDSKLNPLPIAEQAYYLYKRQKQALFSIKNSSIDYYPIPDRVCQLKESINLNWQMLFNIARLGRITLFKHCFEVGGLPLELGYYALLYYKARY
jgi:hypothetical protein